MIGIFFLVSGLAGVAVGAFMIVAALHADFGVAICAIGAMALVLAAMWKLSAPPKLHQPDMSNTTIGGWNVKEPPSRTSLD